jgi:predicted transcriptional regulator YdeE
LEPFVLLIDYHRILMHRFRYDVGFVAALLLSAALLAATDAPKIVHQEEFLIVGIEARTIGERELSGDGEIPGLWRRFYGEHIPDKIPNRADKNIYALYTDYVRDRMADYTVVIGVKVKDKSQVPAGMVVKTIPAGEYAVITSEKGQGETVIPTAWQKVWALEDKDELGGKRAYKTDYEVYDERATDPQNLQADLYAGLNPPSKDHPEK